MIVYHVLPSETLRQTLRTGLAYGEQGQFSKDAHARKTNTYLDTQRPQRWKERNVSRLNCIYAYIALDDMISDIKTGLPQLIDSWNPPANSSVIAIDINPDTVYVGNLALYDDSAACLMDDRYNRDELCRQKASVYWEQLYPLSDVAKYYVLDQPGLRKRSDAPANLPQRLARVEVLIPYDVAPDHLRRRL